MDLLDPHAFTAPIPLSRFDNAQEKATTAAAVDVAPSAAVRGKGLVSLGTLQSNICTTHLAP